MTVDLAVDRLGVRRPSVGSASRPQRSHRSGSRLLRRRSLINSTRGAPTSMILATQTSQRWCSSGFVASSDAGMLADADAIVICVPTPLSDDGGPGSHGGPTQLSPMSPPMCGPGSSSSLSRRPTPGPPTKSCGPPSSPPAWSWDATSSWRSPPSASIRATPPTASRTPPRSSAAALRRAPSGPRTSTRRFIDTVVTTKGTREAEMAKLLENTYRHVNIALVNEMARFCHELDIDLWDVIDAASTKPFGFARLPARSRRRRALHSHRPELPRARSADDARAIRSASSSWLKRSTPGCLTYVVERAREALAERGQPLAEATASAAGRHLQGRHRRRTRVACSAARHGAARRRCTR